MKINKDLVIEDTNFTLKDVTEFKKFQGDLLWTNPTLNRTAFTEQDIIINALPNYHLLEVWFYRNTTYDSIMCIRILNNPNAYCSGEYSFWENGTQYTNYRQFRINPAGNSIHFFQGYLNNNVDNTRGIPLYVVGYPLSFLDS